MKRYERRLSEPKSAKARADHRYYLKNRDQIIARSKARYAARKTESLAPSLPDPVLAQNESPGVSEAPSKQPSLFRQWIQRLMGKLGGQETLSSED